jgi:ribonucleotide reductase, class II
MTKSFEFPPSAPAGAPVFYRTYSRRNPDTKKNETWTDVVDRCTKGLTKLGKFTPDEEELVRSHMTNFTSLPSGRWLWIGGTPWLEEPKNFSGAYNCTSTELRDIEAFGLQFELLMMGCGTGAVIDGVHGKLPPVARKLRIEVYGEPGTADRVENTHVSCIDMPEATDYSIVVGDSREGWRDALLAILKLAFHGRPTNGRVDVCLSALRPPGAPIRGFGGTANPIRLGETFRRIGAILDGAVGRCLTSVECCLILDECAMAVVAGNVRRSAGMRQFSSDDLLASEAKKNLWIQDSEGVWKIDPKRDALRMANHTRVFWKKPSYREVLASVRSQYESGEGAIMFAPEALRRANADILPVHLAPGFLSGIYATRTNMLLQTRHRMSSEELRHRLDRYGLNPCGEVIGKDFHCNLSEVHLNLLDTTDLNAQIAAFKAAALSACALLHHKFVVRRYRKSRELDPIVGVSFTGLFDFFVHAFGARWLQWWADGRPEDAVGRAYREREGWYLRFWRQTVEGEVRRYCTEHQLRCPNRCTTVQPAGTKSLLTGASPGWHPPKAQRFIRRITMPKDDPVALACIAQGYRVIPSASSTDEEGNLLDNPADPRVAEWLVEIPTEVSWANLPGVEEIDISKFSAVAQFDFFMQVQEHYTRHNTSATIEFRENEIEPLAKAIFTAIQEDRGYISAALCPRIYQTRIGACVKAVVGRKAPLKRSRGRLRNGRKSYRRSLKSSRRSRKSS